MLIIIYIISYICNHWMLVSESTLMHCYLWTRSDMKTAVQLGEWRCIQMLHAGRYFHQGTSWAVPVTVSKLQMYTRCRCTCTRLTSRGWALCVVFLYICIVGLMFPATERTGDKPCRCQEGYTSESPQAAIGKKRHLIPITTTFKSHQGCVLLSVVNIW